LTSQEGLCSLKLITAELKCSSLYYSVFKSIKNYTYVALSKKNSLVTFRSAICLCRILSMLGRLWFMKFRVSDTWFFVRFVIFDWQTCFFQLWVINMMGRTRREIIILRIPLKNLTYSHGFIRARLKTIVERGMKIILFRMIIIPIL